MIFADIPNPVTVVTDLIGGAVGWAFDKVAEGIAKWVLGGVEFFVNGAINFLRTSSRPDVLGLWFSGPSSPYATVRNLAGVLLLAFVFLGLLQGLIAGDPFGMVRRMAGQLPAAVAGMVLTTVVVAKLLELTDAMSDMVLSSTSDQSLHFLSNFGSAVSGVGAAFAAVILGLFAIFAGLLLWIELIVRAALVYLLVAISPLGFAATLWPAARGFLRRTVELLLAIIFAKLAVTITLAIGVAATFPAGAGGAGLSSGDGSGLGTVLVGTVLLGLAAFAPFLVLRLIPMVESAVAAQGISRSPLRAAQSGLSMAYSKSMLTRLSGGNFNPAATGTGSAGSEPRATPAAVPTATGGPHAGDRGSVGTVPVAAGPVGPGGGPGSAVPGADATVVHDQARRDGRRASQSGRSAGAADGGARPAPPRPKPAPPIAPDRNAQP